MMIGPIQRARPAIGAAGARPGVAGSFSVPSTVEPDGMAACVDPVRTMSAAGGSMMLALQEHTAQDLADREARRHGQAVIEQLAALQLALLSDTPTDIIETLSSMLRTEPRGAHPALSHALSSIRLRARIALELLSRGR